MCPSGRSECAGEELIEQNNTINAKSSINEVFKVAYSVQNWLLVGDRYHADLKGAAC